MRYVDVIIPVKNEAENISPLVERIDKAMGQANVSYRVLFVDDYSSDNTVSVITSLKRKYPIVLFHKQGRQGKAFSVLEANQKSQAEYVALIDADLQYPPEAIPKMLKKTSRYGVVVANRRINSETGVRKILSHGFAFVFAKQLYGLTCDVQSGLKVFRRDILEHINPEDVTGWTLDLPLLDTAIRMGYEIGETDIKFDKRHKGKSKVKLLKTMLEIGGQALKYKLKTKLPIVLKPSGKRYMEGAGFIYNGKKFITHTTLDFKYSALTTATLFQKLAILVLLGLILYGFYVSAMTTAKVVVALLSIIYFVDVLFNLYLLVRSLYAPPEIVTKGKDLQKLDDKTLPIYTILCPLYREAKVVSRFIQSVSRIDWPKNRLDIILLLEKDDKETQKAVKTLSLPTFVRTLVVPESYPKTKPKACNYGLNLAKGDYLVIYDAEDRPDPLQLKKAYLAFKKVPKEVKCLQAKLNYYNQDQNLLTRFFTAEYSLWFDITLTGLQSIETTIPLGGTSNHFRTTDLRQIEGWDAFNVTEDCDLGMRLFKRGCRTAIIDSLTLEEANSKFKNWLRQRSRWIKGYMQTYLVHNRFTSGFNLSHKTHFLFFHLIVGGKIAFILINPIMWLLTLGYFTAYEVIGPSIEAVYPPVVFYMAVTSLVFGNFLFMYYYMVGVAKRKQWDVMLYVFLVPIYWLMISLGATVALFQLVTRPHYWEKTHHGLVDTKKSQNKQRVSLFPYLRHPRYAWHLHETITSRVQTRSMAFSQTIENFSKIIYKNLADLIYIFSTSTPPVKSNGERKPRILIFNWRDTKHVWAGGAELYLHEVAKSLVCRGNQVTLLCGNDGYHKRRESVDGVEIVRLGGFYTTYLFTAFYYLLHCQNTFDAVIDSENGIPFFTPLYVQLPVFLVVYHVHQNVFRTHLLFPLSQLAMMIESKLMPRVYRGRQVITISDSSKKEILEVGNFSPGSVHIVSPGLDTKQYQRTNKTPYPSFIYLGRLRPYKNIDIAIKAFARVSADLPKARLCIAGEGESELFLKKLARDLKIDGKVRFTGKVSEEEKVKLLSESWVAVQPSQFEGWGLTVIEANACGTPVIASNVNGLSDSVVNGKTGILIEPRNILKLELAMKKIVSDKKMRQSFSESAFAWAHTFNWERSVDELAEVLQSPDLEQNALNQLLYVAREKYC
ncbi:MAG: glycosyltransferase [Patescibacteria group bacterium]|jgi:cellulose synthase/poly-beta-1,6-N-acetylglucosamine synthase-like glycosyltransferase